MNHDETDPSEEGGNLDEPAIYNSGTGYIQANSIANVYLHSSGHSLGELQQAKPEDQDELAKSRQAFLFDFYRQALKQADTTFRMSVGFMSVGAIIVLSGGISALVRFVATAQGNGVISLLTALGGVIIGSCGGAFAVHASRARRHLTRQAERMEKELQSDRRLAQTLRLVDEVEDPLLRDRLKSVTAMRVLDLGPDPESVTQHLLAKKEKNPNEIEPND